MTTPAAVLYSFRRCPYAMRARMALLVAGAAVEVREVVLRDKPAEMIAASPKATVPVLVTADRTVVDQSLDIMHWALRANDPEGWLAADEPALIEMIDGAFKHHLDGYKYGDRNDPAVVEHRSAALTLLHDLDHRLSAQANLSRATRGLSDVATFPFVRQFASVDRSWFDEQPLPHLRRWLDQHIASPLFAQAMVRLDRWTPGMPPVTWPPAAAQ